MKKRYTRKNQKGIKVRSTLLTALDKMQKIRREATATSRRRGQFDYEKGLSKMAEWLAAAEKCPPRHYGKVWNDEKQVIVNQCRALYEEMQKFAKYHAQPFMGNRSNSTGPSDRYISMDRLRWNMGKQAWDYTNEHVTSKDQYWQPPKKPAKCVTLSDRWTTDSLMSDQELAYLSYEVNLMKKEITTGDKLTRTVGWTPGRFAHRIIEWT
jgi:hypothetical protein